jgi:molybdopterin-guanine dinucleotide biosynthesis protein A
MSTSPTADVPEVCGLVLSGGRSRRMGSDKAELQIDGRSQLQRVMELLEQCVGQTYLSLRPDQATHHLRREYEQIPDTSEGLGPTAGLLAAHAFRPDVAWLVVACDMPSLDVATLRRLLAERRPELAATTYLSPTDNRPEPLCSIYEPVTLAHIQELVAAGECKGPRKILEESNAYLIPPENPDTLKNVNTPQDVVEIGGGE